MTAVFILTGLSLLVYPTARQWYFDYRQHQFLVTWAEVQMARALRGPEESVPTVTATSLESTRGLASCSHLAQDKYVLENMEGVLTIDKINLKIPVLKEDSEENLNISVSHVVGSVRPGEVGNYVIAGHHMRAYGRHFNRLHELAKGDEIKFIGPEDATYVYCVFEILVVKSEDTWVLQSSGGEKLITLVTCDYSQKPSMRLIVRGKLAQ